MTVMKSNAFFFLIQKMESKVVVVTGGSSGIGAAIAVHLCEIGYRKLVIVARCQFRQQFTSIFFVQKSFEQL